MHPGVWNGQCVSTDLWTKVIELPVLKSPQYVLRLVSTDSKVETMKWDKELLPHLQVDIVMEQ